MQPSTRENIPALNSEKNSRTATPLLIEVSLVAGSCCNHGMMRRIVVDSESGSSMLIATIFHRLVIRASMALRATLRTMYALGRRFELSSQQGKLAASFGSCQQIGPFPLSRVILQYLALFTSTSHVRDTRSLIRTVAAQLTVRVEYNWLSYHEYVCAGNLEHEVLIPPSSIPEHAIVANVIQASSSPTK
jgi:hypothetical protein